MTTNITDILYKAKHHWYSTPTEATTALLIHAEDPTQKAYLSIPSDACFKKFAMHVPSDFVLLKHKVHYQAPGRSESKLLPGHVAFNVSEFQSIHVHKKLFGVVHIPYVGAYSNGGNWKRRAKEAIRLSGSLPDGLLFDSSVIVNDIKEYIDGIEQ